MCFNWVVPSWKPNRTGVTPYVLMALLLFVASGCGGGTDGQPIAPSTTPAPAASVVAPLPEPLGPCENQRELALKYPWNAFHPWGALQVVYFWDHNYPIRFDIDRETIRTLSQQINYPNFLEEQILAPIQEMAKQIEDRLGYKILLAPSDSDGESPIQVPFPKNDDYTIHVGWRDEVWSPGWGHDPQTGGLCGAHVGSPWNAQGTPPAVWMNRHFFDTGTHVRCYDPFIDGDTIVHEIGHVLGMGHDKEIGFTANVDYLAMSDTLTLSVDPYLSNSDIDNFGCIFPHPDFPR